MNGVRAVGVDGAPESVSDLAEALRAALDGDGPAVLPVRARPGDEPPLPEPVTRAVRDGLPDGLAVVVATSGSTGEPKHVGLTADALRASAAATEARLGGPGSWLLALPAEHVAGLQVVLRALLAGSEPVVQDVRDGFRPEGLARATGRVRHGSRRYTSLVPTQLARVLDHGSAPLCALAGYAAVLVGGAALDPGLRSRAEDAGVRVVTTYGMSETCGGCVYDGVPLDGVRVTVEPGSGRVVLGGPVVATGYLGDPAATAAAFGPDGFRTSDLGEVAPNGTLTVLGRADDVVVTGGEKVAPAAVERALLGVGGVRAACAVGLPDDEWGQVVAALVVTGGPGAPDDPGDPALRDAVRDACGRAAVPRVLIRADTVPERGIGKPDRAAVAALLSRTRPAG